MKNQEQHKLNTQKNTTHKLKLFSIFSVLQQGVLTIDMIPEFCDFSFIVMILCSGCSLLLISLLQSFHPSIYRPTGGISCIARLLL